MGWVDVCVLSNVHDVLVFLPRGPADQSFGLIVSFAAARHARSAAGTGQERRREVNSNDTCRNQRHARAHDIAGRGWIPPPEQAGPGHALSRCESLPSVDICVLYIPFLACCFSPSPCPLFLPRPRKRARNVLGVRSSSLLSFLRSLDDFVDVVWWRLLWELLFGCEGVGGFRGSRRLVRIDGGSSWSWRVDGGGIGVLGWPVLPSSSTA